MQPSDLLILFSITVVSGYLAGFMTVKINHILVIILGRLWSSGHAQQRYIPLGASAAAQYIVSNMLVYGNGEFVLVLMSLPIFIGLYVAGIVHAERRFKQSLEIMNKIIQILYSSDKSGDSSTDKTYEIAKGILEAMPESNIEALKLLFFFFDSAFAVFFISLSEERFRPKRFINLRREEQIEYLETWIDNQYLFYAIKAINSLLGFSYYTNSEVWSRIGYNGELLKRSYLD